MSYPTPDENHVAEGLEYLIAQYRDKVTIKALITAFLNRVQDIEDVLWDVIESGMLATPPTGNALDQVADLVGVKRGGFTDAQLLVFTKAAIIARRSGGRANDIINVCADVLSTFAYQEFYPAAFQVTAYSVPADYAWPIALALRIARDPGVLGTFDWSNQPKSQCIVLGDSVEPVAGQGFADSTSGNFPFQLGCSFQV